MSEKGPAGPQRKNSAPVEIPETLIRRLQGLGPHFCLVATQSKDPSVGGKGWQLPENLMHADDPKLVRHLKRGGNYGVVGGFGLTILDADTQEIKWLVGRNLPQTFTVESPGSKGWHCYFLCGMEKTIRLRDQDGENVGDVQGLGKMVVGPGSIHPNGGVYQIIRDAPLAQVTREQIIEALKPYVVPDTEIEQGEATAKMERQQTNLDIDITQAVPLSSLKRRGDEYYGPHPAHGSKGGQNFWVNPSKNVWHCFRHGTGGGSLLWLAVEERIIDCAEAGPGALRGDLFKQVLKKAKDRGLIKELTKLKKDKVKGDGEGRRSQADKLVQLCLDQKPELFHDQHGTPYARITQDGIKVTLPTRGRPFKAWLTSLLWEAEEKAPGNEGVYSALNVLEAMARFEGKEYTLYNRVAPAEDGFWVDMADDGWRAIKITREGWEIVGTPPILFRRYSHQKPLPEPKPSGDPWKFLDFVNVPKENMDDRLSLLCTVISFLIPTIPHVIPVLYGIQGSGKTILFKLIRRLIDPSSVEVLTLPRDERERVQQLDHHWCAFFDNVTSLPPWMSDTLCRAATGGGFTKRELYTDDDDIIYNFKRCVGLNGINIAAQQGDLLDRSLLIGLQDIPKEKRRTEEQLLAEFEGCKADILGGFLDTLVKALQLYPSVNPKGLYRMADFTRWGIAIAKALGHTEEEFLEAYGTKVKTQIEEAAYASPVATILLDYMETLKGWEGTPSELFTILFNHAKELGTSTRQRAWPKAPHVLVRQLNELAPSLKSLGWEVETTRTSKARKIMIRSVTSVIASQPSQTEVKPSDACDGSDASSPISSSGLFFNDIKVIHWSDDFCGEHECCVCGYKKWTTWKAETFKGERRPICEDCKLEWDKKREEV